MRILVLSDSHGNTAALRKAINAQKEAKHIFFLGDNIRDIESVKDDYPDRTFYSVSGNCDFGSLALTTDIAVIEGRKILFTHGHKFFVKQSTVPLRQAAAQRNIQIALFGHTHIPVTVYEEGVWLVNPGSVSAPREGRPTYAVIDIEQNGIMPIIIGV